MKVSASQVKTWRLCQRRWWFQAVLGRAAPSTPAQSLGTVTHAICEVRAHLDGWTSKDPGELDLPDDWEEVYAEASTLADLVYPVARALAPGGVLTEWEFTFPVEGLTREVTVGGFVDVVAEDGGLVVDYKTTSQRRYVPTADQLRADPQAVIYARAAALLGSHHPRVAFVYAIKRPLSVSVVAVDIPADSPAWRGVVEDISAMARLRATIASVEDSWLRVPPTGAPSGCKAYGGCPFAKECFP